MRPNEMELMDFNEQELSELEAQIAVERERRKEPKVIRTGNVSFAAAGSWHNHRFTWVKYPDGTEFLVAVDGRPVYCSYEDDEAYRDAWCLWRASVEKDNPSTA